MKKNIIKASITLMLLSSASSFANEHNLIDTNVIQHANQLLGDIPTEQVYQSGIVEGSNGKIEYIRLIDGTVAVINNNDFIVFNDYTTANYQVTGKDGSVTSPLIQDMRYANSKIYEANSGKGVLFKAKDEKVRLQVYFDPFCGYCRKLHENQESFLDKGISLEYIPHPIYDNPTKNLYTSSKSLAWMTEPKDNEVRKERLDLFLNSLNQSDTKEKISLLVDNSDPALIREIVSNSLPLVIKGTPYILYKDGTSQPSYIVPEQVILPKN